MRQVSLDQIDKSPFQPRLEFKLEDLKEKIEKEGIIAPAIARMVNGRYELIDGQRRWMCAQELGLEVVPVEVIEADDERAEQLNWDLNMEREDYSTKEKALKFWTKFDGGKGMNPHAIAKRFMKGNPVGNRKQVVAYLNVFSLPETYQERVWSGDIPIRNIRALESLFRDKGRPQSEIQRLLDTGKSEEDLRRALNGKLAEQQEQRVQEAQEAMGELDSAIELETPEGKRLAAATLEKEAKKQVQQQELELLAELDDGEQVELRTLATAVNKEKRQEEDRKKAEKERKATEEAEARVAERAEKVLQGDKEFMGKALEALSPSQMTELAEQLGGMVDEDGRKKAMLKALQQDGAPQKLMVPPPEGKYRTITIDPPWPMEKILRLERPNQTVMDYPTMTIDEIKALPITDLADEDGCHIYLWTTHKYLPTAFEILGEWGASYECVLTWVKNVGITPFSWMYSTELCLFARVGSLELLQKGKRLDIHAKVKEHSRKPAEFYELVREVSPEPRLDYFSREKIEGFEQYGNEVDKFSTAAV